MTSCSCNIIFCLFGFHFFILKNCISFCGVVGDNCKLARTLGSSGDICQSQTAADLNSSHLTHRLTLSTASSDVPSKKHKHGYPLSVYNGHRLLVKGFTFDYIRNKIRKAASGSVGGDWNGDHKEASGFEEKATSPKSDSKKLRWAGPVVVQRCTWSREEVVDDFLLTDDNT